MKTQVLLASALTLLSFPSLAFASNFYFLWELGKSKYDVDVSGELEFFSFEEKSTLIGMGAGYKFNDYVALELSHRQMGDIANRYIQDFGGGDFIRLDRSYDVNATQISLLGTLPLNEQFSVYGRVGYADLDLNYADSFLAVFDDQIDNSFGNMTSKSAKKTLIGFGANYSIASNMTLRGEYNQYAEWKDVTFLSEDINISSFSIGFTYQL